MAAPPFIVVEPEPLPDGLLPELDELLMMNEDE